MIKYLFIVPIAFSIGWFSKPIDYSDALIHGFEQGAIYEDALYRHCVDKTRLNQGKDTLSLIDLNDVIACIEATYGVENELDIVRKTYREFEYPWTSSKKYESTWVFKLAGRK